MNPQIEWDTHNAEHLQISQPPPLPDVLHPGPLPKLVNCVPLFLHLTKK